VLGDFIAEAPVIYHNDSAVETPLTGYIPAFHRKARISSGSFVGSPLDPFLDEDDFELISEGRRKKARTSWGGHSRWRLADKTPSPKKAVNEAGPTDDIGDIDMDITEPAEPSFHEDHVEEERDTSEPIDLVAHIPSMQDPPQFKPYRDPISSVTYSSQTQPTPTRRRREPLAKEQPDTEFSKASPKRTTRNLSESSSESTLERRQALEREMLFQEQEQITYQAPEQVDEDIVHSVIELTDETSLQNIPKDIRPSQPLEASPEALLSSSVPPSPETQISHSSSDETRAGLTAVMPPPVSTQIGPITPLIEPLPSSTLPMPSPFPQDALPIATTVSSTGYFPRQPSFATTSWPSQTVVPDSTFGFTFGSALGFTPITSQERLSQPPVRDVNPYSAPAVSRSPSPVNDQDPELEFPLYPSVDVADTHSRDMVIPETPGFEESTNDGTSLTIPSSNNTVDIIEAPSHPAAEDNSYVPSQPYPVPTQSQDLTQRPRETIVIDLTQTELNLSSEPEYPVVIPDNYESETLNPHERTPDMTQGLHGEGNNEDIITSPPQVSYSHAEIDDLLSVPYPSQAQGTQIASELNFGAQAYDDADDWTRLPSSPLGHTEDTPYSRDARVILSTDPDSPQRRRYRNRDAPTMNQSGRSHFAISPIMETQSLPKVIPETQQFAQYAKSSQEIEQSRENVDSIGIDDSQLSPAPKSRIERRITRSMSITDANSVSQQLRDVIPDSQPSSIPEANSQRNTRGDSQNLTAPSRRRLRKKQSSLSTITSDDSSQVLEMLSQAKSKSDIRGLRTAITYYTPLPHLITYINRSSQQEVSIIAVVVRATTTPERAEVGQRDYFTKFRVSQPDAWPTTTLVSVFRPFKKALPTLGKGDVVLLSMFGVMALKGGTNGLRSGEKSGWCIWTKRPGDEAAAKDAASVGGMKETMGPPVELGDEERAEVGRMAKWWASVEEAKL
jgi:hypothetical protein